MKGQASGSRVGRQILVGSLLACGLWGQTEIDLRSQTKNVDFSGAASTKPMQTGSILPATCGSGQVFFLTSAAAGSNLYACTATNIWSLETGGGGGGGSVSGSMAASASGSGLTIGTDCSVETPCNVRFTNRVVSIVTPAVATITSGNAPAGVFIYVDSSTGDITLANTGTAAIGCTGCTVTSGSAFPANSFPMYVWTSTSNGAWDLFQSTFDKRAAFSSAPAGVGGNLTLTVVNGQQVIAYDPSSGLSPTGAFDASGASLTRPNRTVSADPSGACPGNQEVVLSGSSGNLFSCLAGAWHAAGGGGSSANWSAASGNWVPWIGSSGSEGPLALHTVYGWEFTAPFTMTFSHIGFKETSTGSHYSLGFFNAATGGLIAQSNVTTASTSTVQLAFTSPVTLTAGNVYILAISDDDGNLTFTGPANTNFAGIVNSSGTPRVFTCSNQSVGTSALAFPASCGSRSSSTLDPPLVAFLF